MARRGSGEGGIWYDHAEGYWRASIELGWVNGKRVRWRAKARKKADLLAKVDKARLEKAATGTVATRRRSRGGIPTVGEWCKTWLSEHAKRTVRPSTFGKYSGDVRNYITPLIGDIPITQLEPGDVRAMLNTIKDQGKAPTARSVHRTLHAALAAAMVDRKVGENVAGLVKDSRTDARRDDTLTVDEAIAILAESLRRAETGDAEAVQRHAIDATRLLTGLRPQEILGIEDTAVDLAAGRLSVDWQLQEVPYAHGCGDEPCGRKFAGNCPRRRLDAADSMEARQVEGRWCLTRPKTARSQRPIPLAPMVVDAYRAHRRARGLVGRGTGLLFVRKDDGGPIRESDDLAAWRDLCAAAGIERKVDRYIGRHTTASLLGELGVDPDVIASMLGHSDRATTSIYKHQSDGAMRDAIDRLDARLRPAN